MLFLESGLDYPDFEHLPEEVKYGYATAADIMTSDQNGSSGARRAILRLL